MENLLMMSIVKKNKQNSLMTKAWLYFKVHIAHMMCQTPSMLLASCFAVLWGCYKLFLLLAISTDTGCDFIKIDQYVSIFMETHFYICFNNVRNSKDKV